EGCIALTELDIPETTVAIGDRAFANCSLLESISLPATLTTFGTNGAATIFEGCSDISEISVALGCEVLESRSGILYGKMEGVITDLIFVPAGLTGAIELPNTITNVPEKVFYGHRGITQITFEDGTASANLTIGEYAFANMSAIKKIVLPSGLATIPRYMASNSSLEEIFIPNTVSYLRQAAFYNCTDLETITFEDGNESNVLTLDPPDEWGNMDRYVRTFSNVPAATIELRRVVKIPDYYFCALQAKKIILPGTLTTICEGAFDKSALEEIVFAKKEDGTRAPLTLEDGAFQQSTSLKSVTIPNNIVSSVEAFYNCKELETVVFEAGSTNIGANMFQSCTKLTSVTFVDSITTIGKYAFQNCDGLEKITLPANLTEIPDYLFGGTISAGNFLNPTPSNSAAEGLKEITIPASVTKIGANAFTNCTSLAKVTFATGCQITEIGDYAFENTALTSFSVPQLTAGTTKLGLSILKDCASLASVSFPSTVIDLNSALLGCSALTSFTHAVAGTSVDETNKIIYADNGKRLVLYYGDATELVIPSTVEEIGDGAFTGKTSLTKVTIPDSVKVIGDNAFQNCTALATVELNSTSGLVELGNYAFANTAITSISLPATMVDRGVEEENVIGEYAFRDCTALTTVAVNGTAMGRGMFYDCTSLKNVTLNKNITNFYGESFRGCTSLENITLPEKLVTVYAWEFYGCTSLQEVTLPDDLTLEHSYNSTSIKYEDQMKPNYHGIGMFYGCTSLSSVTLNDSLTELPSYMFYQCTSLTELDLPDGLIIMGSYSLYGCTGLTELTFPDTLEDVYYLSVFRGCTGLTKLDF
ncbi:MAG: leucine-rich repeat domain-containing protein, partial [Clostridia bacterium]|nr:leucine-rich repeat domain-containing protein [Clostridia bacterium]